MSDLDDNDTQEEPLYGITSYDIDDMPPNSIGAQRVMRSRELNSDEPKPTMTNSRELASIISNIDQRVDNKLRLPMNSNRNVTSVRIVSDASRRSNQSSVRSYKPSIEPSRKQEVYQSPEERAYIWRQKFIRLNARNPKVEIPELTDPDVLGRLYTEALKTDHYSSSSATWLLYMGMGYAAFQGILHKLGISLPHQFVFYQVDVMSCYPQILKSLGEPGGPSIGSNWPPWMKLAFIVCLHTITFVLIYKLTGSETSAYSAQKAICGTGLMGGKPQAEESVSDNAQANLGGILSGFGNLLGGGSGGGMMDMMQGLIGGLMGGTNNATEDIDLDNPPDPVSYKDANHFDSRRKSRFD